jgi:hypothetical protein
MLMIKEYWLEEKKKENYHTRSLCVWIFANSFLIRLDFPFHVKTLTEKYKNFANVFDKINVDKLLKHDSQDHAINTKSKMFSFELMYNLSMIKFELFKKYFDEFLTKEFIVFSSSFVDVSILFVKKSKNDLKLCVNYKKLNVITIKNRYSIFLIN